MLELFQKEKYWDCFECELYAAGGILYNWNSFSR